MVDWVLGRTLVRVALVVTLWVVALVPLALLADGIFWLGVALGALLPVSFWIAWNGFHVRGADGLDYFLALTPCQFEGVVARLMRPLWYTDIRVVCSAADLGVDVLCRDRRGRRVAIQCKRFREGDDVSSSEVQTFMGGMVAHQAERGIIVTTSAFSAPARDLGRDQGILLIDGAELSRMLAQEEASLAG